MPDKNEATETKEGYEDADGQLYRNKQEIVGIAFVNDGPYMTDKYISFQNSDYENPYEDPTVLKIEDIFGFMMAYRKPYSDANRKSLKNYRNRLRKHCKTCIRLPKCYIGNDRCRTHYLKVAMTREIKGLIITIDGDRYLSKVLVKK